MTAVQKRPRRQACERNPWVPVVHLPAPVTGKPELSDRMNALGRLAIAYRRRAALVAIKGGCV